MEWSRVTDNGLAGVRVFSCFGGAARRGEHFFLLVGPDR